MPFDVKLSIDQFVPDACFDPNMDLVAINLNGQKLYVSNHCGIWAIPASDATMSDSMRSSFLLHETSYPGSPGIRVDAAEIGSHALFGAGNWDWRGIWCSQEVVTGFEVIRRTDILRSTVVIDENR